MKKTYYIDEKIAMLDKIQATIDIATQREIEKLKSLLREPQEEKNNENIK